MDRQRSGLVQRNDYSKHILQSKLDMSRKTKAFIPSVKNCYALVYLTSNYTDVIPLLLEETTDSVMQMI